MANDEQKPDQQHVTRRDFIRSVTTVTMGSWNEALRDVSVNNTRELQRFTIGANGDFGAFGTDWSWDTFYNKNVSDIFQSANSSANAAYREAIDAVVVTAANVGTSGLQLGSIACRSTLTNPTNGCAPLNILGIGVASQAGIVPQAPRRYSSIM